MTSLSNIPGFIIKKAKLEKSHTSQEIIQAKARIDEKYHDFLVMLPQNVKLTDKQYKLNSDAEELGVWSTNRGTYVSIEKPYMTVDGRVQLARDEHKAAGKKFSISAPTIEKFDKQLVVSVTIDSEIYGSANGMIEIGDSGAVDTKNPFANAQTSAIGRALGFLGYGLVGKGIIASANELDGDQEPSAGPEIRAGNSTGATAPESYRVMLLEAVRFNRDGSSTVNIKMETQEIVSLVIPKAHIEFAKTLQKNMIVQCKGWLNDKRLRVSNDAIEIEPHNAAS